MKDYHNIAAEADGAQRSGHNVRQYFYYIINSGLWHQHGHAAICLHNSGSVAGTKFALMLVKM